MGASTGGTGPGEARPAGPGAGPGATGAPSTGGSVVPGTDVTDRVQGLSELTQLARELSRRDDLYRGLFETMTQGVVYHDADGAVMWANPAAFEMLGLTLEEMIGRTSVDPRWHTVHADGSPFPGEEHPAPIALRTGEAIKGVEMGVFNPQEERVRWLLVSAVPQHTEDGSLRGVFATFEDITLRREAQEALQESLRREQENRFRRAIDALPESVLMAEPVREDGAIVDFAVVYANESVSEIGGRAATELVGRRFTDLWPGITESGLLTNYVRVVETGEPLVLEPLGYRDSIDGRESEGVYDVRVTTLGDDLFLAWRDVTERFQHEAALRESEAALAEAQRIARLGSWEWLGAENRVRFSTEALRICGLEPSQPGLAIAEIAAALHPDDRFLIERIMERVIDGEPFRYETRIVHPTEGTLHVVLAGETRSSRNGGVQSVRGTLQDVTALRTAERALVASRAQLELERQAVETLQRSILPLHIPDVDGADLAAEYLPAASHLAVGGDWYDTFKLPDGRIALTVGDVTGKGVGAAEIMAKLRNAARMATLLVPGPSDVLDALNRFLMVADRHSLATAVFCLYDPAEGTITWTSAGHLPGVVRRADGRTELLEGANGPLLGAIDADYTEAHATLEPGDALILYTDGLVERRNENIDVGIDRLRQAVAGADDASDAHGLCAVALRECLAGVGLADDTCVLALVRCPTS